MERASSASRLLNLSRWSRPSGPQAVVKLLRGPILDLRCSLYCNDQVSTSVQTRPCS